MSTIDPTRGDLLDFVTTAAMGLHWVGPDGTILWANPADHAPLGYSEAEYIGHNIAEFHADPAAIADILRRLAAGERLHNYRARLRCKDGSTREVLITSSVRTSDAGEFMHTRCFTVDVSAERAVGADLQIEALNREIERLRMLASRGRGLLDAILTHSPHGIIVADAHGKLTVQNKAAERIWAGSATADDIQGWGKYRAFHPDGRPFAPTDWTMARALQEQETVEAQEFHIQRFDDTYGVLLGSAAPLFGPDGALEGAISIFVDITERERQAEAVRLGARRYFTTLASIGDAVIATDAQGMIEFLNPVAEALTGWSFVDAAGKRLDEVFRVVNEGTRAVVESPVDKVIREGAIVGLANHTLLIARDGTEIAIDDSGAPIFAADKRLVGVVLVFRDVTERRREEQRRQFIAEAGALLASSLDYATTLASVARLSVPTIADWCAVDVLDANGGIARLGTAHVDTAKIRAVEELVERYPPDPSSPYGVHEVVRSGRSQLMAAIPDALLVEAAIDDEHLRLLRELGLKSAMLVPLRCRGRTLGAISFVATESNRVFVPSDLVFAEELANIAAFAVDNARLYRDAQDANRTKDEFLATVSHELRTPLNAMLGWASLLRSDTLTEAKREHALQTIERNARAQAKLIDDLLDVSRIISGQLRLELRAVDLNAIIEAAADGIRPAADVKQVAIQLLLDEDARHASGDPGRLQQVVWNLLSNAVKFTENGGRVTVRLRRVDSQAEIEVCDTGIGIEPDFLPHIFERFRRADAATTRSHGGLGLGLAIVRHLVELHGGTVTASSGGPQRGAAFCVRLPLVAAFRTSLASPSSASEARGLPRLDGLRVLVVDDEADARALVATILEGYGATVVAVGSAAHALIEFERRPPDVLVSDIGMPEMDGYALMASIGASRAPGAKTIPAVALTAYARSEDRTRALMAGFQAHVAKPVEADELVLVVATLAGRTSASR